MRRSLRFLVALTALGSFLSPARAIDQLDLSPADGVPDIWGIVHGLGALTTTEDSDGDGQTNGAEAIAGTNPLSSLDVIAIETFSVAGGNVTLVFPGIAGKKYEVQSSPSLTAPSFATVPEAAGTRVASADGDITVILPMGSGPKFYRVQVSDTDSDSDGVSNYEEIQLGLGTGYAFSNGASGTNDLEAVTAALTAPSVFTVVATDAQATEPTGVNPATDLGAYTISRTGGLKPLAVNFSFGGGAVAGADYQALPTSLNFALGAKSHSLTLTPNADAGTESPESAVLTITPNAAYTVAAPGAAGILIHDYTSANGTGLRGNYDNAPGISGTVAPDFSTLGTPELSRVDATINFTQAGSPGPGVNVDDFSIRWTGEVLPEFSQIYTFFFLCEDGVRVFVNGTQLVGPPTHPTWPRSGATNAEFSGTIELQGGVRYPIVIEFYNDTGTSRGMLQWQSANQPKQEIPPARLFPDTAPQIFSSLEESALVNAPPYSYQIVASGSPTSYSAHNLPAGWSINPATGLITGTPTVAGEWDVVLNATNAGGTGSAIMHLSVAAAGGLISRDQWNGTYATLADVPFTTTADVIDTQPRLAIPSTNDATDYGSRLRGYLTAPLTGVYQFWLRGRDEAELWISDDDEPINSWLRAKLPTPGTTFVGTTSSNWTGAVATPLLYLKAGSRYYLEVRQRVAVDNGGVCAVGWLQPGQSGGAPSEIVPGYALSPYTPPPPVTSDGTLYFTSMNAQGGAVTKGYGTATLRMNAAETQAILTYSGAGLTGPITQQHIHSDPWKETPASTQIPSQIIFDIDVATPQPDGSYVWDLVPTATLSIENIRQIIREGAAYINLHTALYPAGEIRGNFIRAVGSQTFTAPAAPPGWTDDHGNRNAAARFLTQATYGPTPAELAALQLLPAGGYGSSYEAWIEDQFTKPATLHLPYVEANRVVINPQIPPYSGNSTFNSWWEKAVTAPDQLRQRMAFALSQIAVVSKAGELVNQNNTISDYYDMLLVHAFGNFRTLIEAVTLHPAMGLYLDMLNNARPNKATGQIPNENYARELKQLFALGLYRMWPDGTLMLNSKGLPIPTYGQEEIIGFANALTGWGYNYPDQGGVAAPYRTTFPNNNTQALGAYTLPMREVPMQHFTGQKRLLNNVVLPGLTTAAGAPLDPYGTPSNAQLADTAFKALSRAELVATHDQLFNHPNVGPFICKQLIQRFVTSTPSTGYVFRVVSKFNDNGSGVRGDLQAVLKAILLDYEARSTAAGSPYTTAGYGKQREPVLRVSAMARAFLPSDAFTADYVQDGGVIAISNTSAPHRLIAVLSNPNQNGEETYLSFAGTDPLATDGTYTPYTFTAGVGGVIPTTTNGFSTRAKDCFRGGVTQTAGSSTVRLDLAAGHGLPATTWASLPAFVRFRSLTPAPGAGADGVYPLSLIVGDFDSVQITFADTVGRTGVCDVHFLRGGYTQDGGAGIINFNTTTRHGLSGSPSLRFAFAVAANRQPAPPDADYVVTVVDDNTFTLTYPPPATGIRGGTFMAAIIDPAAALAAMTRSGTLNAVFSDYTVENTDTNLGQTPLNSPTVFNFYLPDYQYPGPLAAAGLITPEFQLTSETNVMRIQNFLAGGVFGSGTGTRNGIPTGRTSFSNGSGDLAIDFGPWMGARPGGSGNWTDGTLAVPGNLGALIDELSTLLLHGPLPAAAQTAILTVATANGIHATNNGTAYNPTNENHRRDRVRAVVHLLVTSPDFAIQK